MENEMNKEEEEETFLNYENFKSAECYDHVEDEKEVEQCDLEDGCLSCGA